MNEVLTFINKRFSKNCNWLDGNCYYFAIILKERFGGHIYYDSVNCHFIIQINGKFYDWTGIVKPNIDNLLNWEELKNIDQSYYNRIKRDCIL